MLVSDVPAWAVALDNRAVNVIAGGPMRLCAHHKVGSCVQKCGPWSLHVTVP